MALAPAVSLTAPANGATYTSPASIALTATAADSDGTVSKVEFFNGTTLLNSDTTTPYSYTWSNVLPGAYAITAKATDNSGATATSAIANIAVGGTVSYIYDELGRVVGIVDQAGNSGAYSYDSVGNVLSISRKTSTQIALVEFTPNSGPTGTTVTLYGAGFSATASQNTVKFNGTAAVVTSATTAKLVVQVPTGATTGAISITNTKGTATSGAAFSVSASLAPTITSFAPVVGSAGTAVTISGSKFETEFSNNKVSFSEKLAALNSATATTISVTAPSDTKSGKISVATPYGKATSTQDFFVPPAGIMEADIGVTGRINFGETKSFSIASANKVGMVLFDGVAGQRISLLATNTTACPCAISVLNPDGTLFVSSTESFVDAQMLLVSGTYTIIIDPFGASTGNITLALYNVVDISGSVSVNGTPLSVTVNVPGQNARITFSGTAGQVVSLATSSVSIQAGEIDIQQPNGTSLSPSWFGAPSGLIDVLQLPVSGTYTISLDPYLANVGSLVLTLSSDFTDTLTINAAPYTLNMMRPGQNARMTFSGVAGQVVSVGMTGIAFPFGSANIELRNPADVLLASSLAGGSIDLLDAIQLTNTGTYSLTIDPNGLDTGQMTLTLSIDLQGSMAINGSAYNLAISRVGQNARLTFDGTAGQIISLQASGVTIPSSSVEIRHPNGTLLGSATIDTSGALIDSVSLPVTGTYSILVDPNSFNTGAMTLVLVAPSPGDTITVNGPAHVVNITQPGQNAEITFNGTAGQKISLWISNVTLADAIVDIRPPGGGSLLGAGAIYPPSQLIDAIVLPLTGTYTIVIDPSGTDTGGMSLLLSSDFTSTTSIDGPEFQLSLSRLGQNAAITFFGTAGQAVNLWVSNISFASTVVDIRQPGGASLLGAPAIYPPSQLMDTIVLPVTGTYTIVIDPDAVSVGSLSLLLSGNATGSMSITVRHTY